MINLSEQDARNLLIFMDRTKMKGKEVQAWIGIVNAVRGQLKIIDEGLNKEENKDNLQKDNKINN